MVTRHDNCIWRNLTDLIPQGIEKGQKVTKELENYLVNEHRAPLAVVGSCACICKCKRELWPWQVVEGRQQICDWCVVRRAKGFVDRHRIPRRRFVPRFVKAKYYQDHRRLFREVNRMDREMRGIARQEA